jgi:hypothetical protein
MESRAARFFGRTVAAVFLVSNGAGPARAVVLQDGVTLGSAEVLADVAGGNVGW